MSLATEAVIEDSLFPGIVSSSKKRNEKKHNSTNVIIPATLNLSIRHLFAHCNHSSLDQLTKGSMLSVSFRNLHLITNLDAGALAAFAQKSIPAENRTVL